MDRFTREVLGVSVMTEHSAELVVRALAMALLGADAKPLWFHSDQGSEYTSYALTQLLSKHGISASHSPKSSPWRNGSQESFFGRFKVEFGDAERFSTLPELMEAIYSYIAYYNTERIHTAHRAVPSTARAAYQTRLTTYQQLMSLPHTPSRPCGAEEQPLLLI
jgi:transposase InsO family protein